MADIPILGNTPILGQQQEEEHFTFTDVVHRFAAVGNVGPATVLLACAVEELLMQLFDANEIEDIALRINQSFVNYINVPQEAPDDLD